MAERPQTLRELKESDYRPISVKTEMRRNLIRKLESGEQLFPGILGYDETVVPQIVNGILSKHDMLFLGLRGQGKTRMLRLLTQFLDDVIPVVQGSDIHDDPLHPISKYARDRIAEEGDDTPIAWIGREERYLEKLATPDVTIADLIGEIDLIKHAEGRHLASEDVMHFGLIPRSHRGIFCMNELPDLSPKIQVGLFNVLEERDVQIRGFTVRLPIDVCMVFSANPEDYTNRGRIVTPLKDRIGSVVRTHYPLERELGIQILEEQAWSDRDGEDVIVPHFLKEIVEEMSRLARTSPHVNQASGVSVRMSIANLETLVSNAERRSLMHREAVPVARVSDLYWMAASSRGKIELGLSEETGDEDILIHRLIEEAIKNVFDQSLSPKRFANVVEHFNTGNKLKLEPDAPAKKLLDELGQIRGFSDQLQQITMDLVPDYAQGPAAEGVQAAVAELILDGLYAHNRLNRQMRIGQYVYGG